MSQCSELFEDVFSSCCGGALRTCACGRTFFNYTETGCFEDNELKNLEAKADAEPDRFFAVDYTVGTLNIGGDEIVIGCVCDKAAKYERFILSHAESLAEYLRRYADKLRNKAIMVDVPKTESNCDLLAASQLLDDCLIRIYPEEFTPDRKKDAEKRFCDNGGVIARIAKMSDELKQAAGQNRH